MPKNLDSNFNSATWPTSSLNDRWRIYLPWNPWSVWSLNLFWVIWRCSLLGHLKMVIWRLGLWGFVPMSYFCSEINEWWEDCTKYKTRPEKLLWSVTSSREIQKNSIFPAQNLQSSKYLNSRTNSVVQEWKHLFLNQAWHSQQQVLQSWKFSKCCRLGNSVCL